MNDQVFFDSPFFSKWALRKIENFLQGHIEIAEARGFSAIKFAAAVFCVLYGEKGKSLQLIHLANALGELYQVTEQVSVSVLKVWRTEWMFKRTVQELKAKFAAYTAEAIFHGVEEFLHDLHPRTTMELYGRTYLITEALRYDPDMVQRISVVLGNYISAQERHPLSSYLAYYIYCVKLLLLTKESTYIPRKKRELKKALPTIIGRHYENTHLRDFLVENASPAKGLSVERFWVNHFKTGAHRTPDQLARGEYEAIIDVCRKELAAIVYPQIEGASRRKALSKADMSVVVRFLGDANFLADEGHDFSNLEEVL